jgi:hypothetical protein
MYAKRRALGSGNGIIFLYDSNCEEHILVNAGSWKSRLHYGEALVHAGVSGLRKGRHSQVKSIEISAALTRSALASLGLAAICTLAGLSRSRRRSISRTLAYGVAGSVLGFAAGLTWGTRHLTAGMARSAMKEIGALRDEHWIEKHPVNYG